MQNTKELSEFNLEAAKNGELLVNTEFGYNVEAKYIANNEFTVIVQFENKDFGFWHIKNTKMKPLCYIENKPVYKGDTLYLKNGFDTFQIHSADGDYIYNIEGYWTIISCLTWTKPKQKVKKSGWINIYNHNKTTYNGHLGYIFLTKHEAISSASKIGLVDTIEITWEEEE